MFKSENFSDFIAGLARYSNVGPRGARSLLKGRLKSSQDALFPALRGASFRFAFMPLPVAAPARPTTALRNLKLSTKAPRRGRAPRP
jgi:hypothetical protein